MTTPTDGGVLNVDQAAALIIGLQDPEEAPVEAADAPEEAEPVEGEETPPEPAEEPEEAPEDAGEEPADEDAGEEEPEEPAEEEEPAAPVVEPPHFWSAEMKAKFGSLPPDMQEHIAETEKARVAHVNAAQQQFVEARKAATAEAEKFIKQAPKIEALLEEVQTAYKANDWETIDWAAWADADPGAALKGKLQYDAQVSQMQRLEAAKQEAEAEAFKAYTIEQAGELQRLAPDIAADDAKRGDIVNYLIKENGYDPELIRGIRAKDVVIAHKAMLWDRAQSKAKAQTVKGAERPAQAAVPRKVPVQSTPAARPVRPATAATAPSPKRAVVERETSFKAKPSTENAIALLLARGTG